MKTLIVALGGNALIKPSEKGSADEMKRNLRKPIKQIAKLSKDYSLVITHGNGPQVGSLLLQQEATEEVTKMPLEILVAETQGQLGFLIESTLDEELMNLGLDLKKYFLTVLTYVEVDPNDKAFQNPTKPIGPSYRTKRKNYIKTAKGWRRVVPSPDPKRIIQWKEIKKLMEENFIVIACGGGGIPVVKEGHTFHGVEAVIDKDLASAKLGEQINADILLIATDVEKVALNYGKDDCQYLSKLSTKKAKKYMKEGHFPSGTMGPKIQAAINFLEAGGKKAIITSIDKIIDGLQNTAGTHIYLESNEK
ncbi:MAG: carbamate kinase [Promethearchaeati archaeon]